MTYRKIGGLHWFAIGRLRIAFCLVRRRPQRMYPISKIAAEGVQSQSYIALPRANWPLNRAAHYGESAVALALQEITND